MLTLWSSVQSPCNNISLFKIYELKETSTRKPTAIIIYDRNNQIKSRVIINAWKTNPLETTTFHCPAGNVQTQKPGSNSTVVIFHWVDSKSKRVHQQKRPRTKHPFRSLLACTILHMLQQLERVQHYHLPLHRLNLHSYFPSTKARTAGWVRGKHVITQLKTMLMHASQATELRLHWQPLNVYFYRQCSVNICF